MKTSENILYNNIGTFYKIYKQSVTPLNRHSQACTPSLKKTLTVSSVQSRPQNSFSLYFKNMGFQNVWFNDAHAKKITKYNLNHYKNIYIYKEFILFPTVDPW